MGKQGVDVLENLLGLELEPGELGFLQVAVRAAIVFVTALVAVRIGSKRFLGRKTAFDFILAFILGSMFSRAINGSAPFFPTLVGGILLVLIHRLVAILGFHFPKFGTLVKGTDEIVIEDGRIRPEALQKNHLTEKDLLEDLRLKSHGSPEEVKCARFEPSGDLSVIPKRE